MIAGMPLGSIIIGTVLHSVSFHGIVIANFHLKVTRATLRCHPRVFKFRFPVGCIRSVPFVQVSTFPLSERPNNFFQIKIWIHPTLSKFSSSFLPQHLLWMNTPHP
jgi:hypothetical protein